MSDGKQWTDIGIELAKSTHLGSAHLSRHFPKDNCDTFVVVCFLILNWFYLIGVHCVHRKYKICLFSVSADGRENGGSCDEGRPRRRRGTRRQWRRRRRGPTMRASVGRSSRQCQTASSSARSAQSPSTRWVPLSRRKGGYLIHLMIYCAGDLVPGVQVLHPRGGQRHRHPHPHRRHLQGWLTRPPARQLHLGRGSDNDDDNDDDDVLMC